MSREPMVIRAAAAAGRRRGALVLLLLAPSVLGAAVRPQQGEPPLRLDRSGGSYAGLVWLVSSEPGAPATEQFVGVAIGRLPDADLEQSFALRAGPDGPVFGPAGSAPADLLAADRSVMVVEVDYRAHDEVRHLIARWAQGEQVGTEPAVRIENLLDRVASTIGLKTPYRSVLRGSDPVVYLRDLARINGGNR